MRVRKRFKIDGVEVSEAEYMRRRKATGIYSGGANTYSEARPLEGVAMAVHPKQVKAAREQVAALGLSGVNYKDDGTIQFTSRGSRGRNGFLKAMGCHDNDAGYGDRAGP